MDILIILGLAIIVITISLLLRGGKKHFIDFILLCVIGFAVDIICKDFLNISGIWYYMCEVMGFVLLELACAFYTMRTETITISAKAKQIRLFGTNNVIKTKNNKTFTIDNDIFIQWHAKELNKKIRVGYKYKIKAYRLLFTNCKILSATEIKTQKRKATKK